MANCNKLVGHTWEILSFTWYHRWLQPVSTMGQDAQKPARKFCAQKTAEKEQNAPGKARKRRNRVRSGCWRGVQPVRTDGKTGIDRHRTCLGCRLGRFAPERHWRSLTPRHALRRAQPCLVAKTFGHANEKRRGKRTAYLSVFGRGRRTRTLGTRFWSGCGNTPARVERGRCCPVPPASPRESGAELVLCDKFSG